MLTILGGRNSSEQGYCDGIARRNFLKIGGLALGGLSLPGLLEMEAQAGNKYGHKALINVYLPGGPPHLDMWDLKPEAPIEVRGEFNPIDTNVPGIQICEHFPRMAQMMDKFVPIRSMADAQGGHDGYQCMTGRVPGGRMPPGGWPAAGAWVSKLQGPTHVGCPPHLSLMYKTGERRWGDPQTGGFLGVGHSPFPLLGREARSSAENMVLQGISLERLQDRVSLMKSIDLFRREADGKGMMSGMDTYTSQAMGILTSAGLAEALDLSKEDPKIVERYGKSITAFQRDGAPPMVENFCIARRLVEAGARVVSMNFSRWDWHGPDGMNFPEGRTNYPLLDQGLCALVSDLDERGMLGDVSIVVWGEFGRTPKINNMASRDHWPQVSCALLAGGRMRTGQVIGSTNRLGEHAVDRPVKFQEVFATLYHNLGIDSSNHREFDLAGVPQYLVDPGIVPMRELI